MKCFSKSLSFLLVRDTFFFFINHQKGTISEMVKNLMPCWAGLLRVNFY